MKTSIIWYSNVKMILTANILKFIVIEKFLMLSETNMAGIDLYFVLEIKQFSNCIEKHS